MVMKTKITNHEWYQAYCAAMLESDVEKMIASVESARQAIQKRARELDRGSNLESLELDRAQRFLTMLVNCSVSTQVSVSKVYAN